MKTMIKVEIVNKCPYGTPEYQTEESAGCDLYANIDAPMTLAPLDRVSIPTGISIALPEGYEAQVRGRSGLNRKNGIVVPVGTVDSDYRGEIGVVFYNLSRINFTVNPGDRIAQLVISPIVHASWMEKSHLAETHRGAHGFGSTGI